MDFVIYWKTWLQGVCRERTPRGSAMVEYALLLGLIAMVCLLAIALFGEEMSRKYDSVASNIDSVP